MTYFVFFGVRKKIRQATRATPRKAGWLRHLGGLCLSLLLLAPAQTLAQGTPQAPEPRLRSQVEVVGELVTLGDLLENAGEKGRIAVFRAPDPGTEGRVSARRIQEAAERHGLRWRPSAGDPRLVRVRRKARLVSLDTIADLIKGEIVQRLSLSSAEDLALTFAPNSHPLRLDVRDNSPLVLRRLVYKPRSGVFLALLATEATKTRGRGVTYRGRVQETVAVPTLRHPVARGERLGPDDIITTRLPRHRLPANVIRDTEALLGKEAKRALRPGQPLRLGDVAPPRLVKKNRLVTLIYEVPGLMLRARGKALADGAQGDVVPVRNLQSQRIVHGTVTGEGLVTVAPVGGKPQISPLSQSVTPAPAATSPAKSRG